MIRKVAYLVKSRSHWINNTRNRDLYIINHDKRTRLNCARFHISHILFLSYNQQHHNPTFRRTLYRTMIHGEPCKKRVLRERFFRPVRVIISRKFRTTLQRTSDRFAIPYTFPVANSSAQSSRLLRETRDITLRY